MVIMGRQYKHLTVRAKMTDNTQTLANKVDEKLGPKWTGTYRIVVNGLELFPLDPWRELNEYRECLEKAHFRIDVVIKLAGGGKRPRTTTTTERHTKQEKLSINDVRLKATDFDATVKVDSTIFQRVQERVKELTTNMDDKWFADKLESMPRQKLTELHNLFSEMNPQEQSISFYTPFFVEEYTMCETLGDECTKAMTALKFAYTKKFIQHFYNDDSQLFQFKVFVEMVVDQHKMNGLMETMKKRMSIDIP